MSLFDKFRQTLTKTHRAFGDGLDSALAGFKKVDEDFLEALEEVLVMSDTGLEVAQSIAAKVKDRARRQKITTGDEFKAVLSDIICEEMDSPDIALNTSTKPSVVMLIGVNGTGKTTTAAKLALYLKNRGKSVLLAAADTFRAAAGEQLDIWAGRIGVDIVRHRDGSDPAAVVYDSIAAATARGTDVIICDTAGRLHNKKQLMDELTKIRRVVQTQAPDAAVEVLLVLDATTGQNALAQAREFGQAASLTGVVLTKLDGTAKGGMAIGVLRQMGIPIKFVGLGERADDFEAFSPSDFARGLVE